MPDAALDQQVLITRVFDAPRARIFQAWTNPDDVAAWYGPEHFDTPRETRSASATDELRALTVGAQTPRFCPGEAVVSPEASDSWSGRWRSFGAGVR